MILSDKDLRQNLKKLLDGTMSIEEIRTLCSAIGKSKYKEGIPALLKFLKDPDEIVRYNAVISLGFDLHYKPATERLLELLAKDSDPDVRDATAGALGVLWQNTAEPRILKALGHSAVVDDDEGVRKTAYVYLLIINGVDREEHLQLLQQQDTPINHAKINEILSRIE